MWKGRRRAIRSIREESVLGLNQPSKGGLDKIKLEPARWKQIPRPLQMFDPLRLFPGHQPFYPL
jgi:hypothetical protein